MNKEREVIWFLHIGMISMASMGTFWETTSLHQIDVSCVTLPSLCGKVPATRNLMVPISNVELFSSILEWMEKNGNKSFLMMRSYLTTTSSLASFSSSSSLDEDPLEEPLELDSSLDWVGMPVCSVVHTYCVDSDSDSVIELRVNSDSTLSSSRCSVTKLEMSWLTCNVGWASCFCVCFATCFPST